MQRGEDWVDEQRAVAKKSTDVPAIYRAWDWEGNQVTAWRVKLLQVGRNSHGGFQDSKPWQILVCCRFQSKIKVVVLLHCCRNWNTIKRAQLSAAAKKKETGIPWKYNSLPGSFDFCSTIYFYSSYLQNLDYSTISIGIKFLCKWNRIQVQHSAGSNLICSLLPRTAMPPLCLKTCPFS